MIVRRQFITLLGSAAAWPLAASAQQGGPIRRVGAMFSAMEDDSRTKRQIAAFEQAMQAHGWVKGRNVQFDYRWPADDAALVQAYATELAGKAPDVILSESIPITRALKQATTTIPIVIVRSGDPVRSGIVASLARPGGNITGFSQTNLRSRASGSI
jgi:putative tryptophan/tyrosine transport system substrate-binding protein